MSELIDELVLHINKTKEQLVDEVECEFRYDVDRRKWGILSKDDTITFAQYIINDALKKKKHCEIQQTINFLANSNLTKRLMFVNGIQDKSKISHYSKIDICHTIHATSKPDVASFAYKLASVVERKAPEFPVASCKHAKIKLRFSIIETNTWRIDITLVKNVDISQPEEIKNQRDIFIKKISTRDFVAQAPWREAEHVEFEAEFIGKKLTNNDIIVANDLLDIKLAESGIKLDFSHTKITTVNDHSISNDYQKLLAIVGQYVLRGKHHAQKSQNISLKQIGNQPIELNRSIFYKDVQPIIDQFYITDKVDGQRCIVLVDKKVNILTDVVKQYETDAKGVYIFDGELLKGEKSEDDTQEKKQDDQPLIYLFDVMVFAGKKLADLPFRQRLPYFEQVADLFPFVKLKPFTLLTDKYPQQITALNKVKHTEYETDGYVLTPANGSYEDMSVYKYKPRDKLTIDFLIKKCPQKLLGIKPYIRKAGEFLYILFCGINKATFYSLNIRPIKYYDEIFPTVNYKIKDYFPMQFETSDCAYAYIYKSTKDDLDGEVGEFRLLKVGGAEQDDAKQDKTEQDDVKLYEGATHYLPAWELVRIREDRRLDIANGTYFGNNNRIAELIWYNYKYPVVLEDQKIGQKTDKKSDDKKSDDKKTKDQVGYFQSHESEKHKSARNFNSFVKSEIFKTFQSAEWVFDMASGKGQDLARYRDNSVKNLLCVELDSTAIVELISRKYDLVTRMNRNFKKDRHDNFGHDGGIKLFVEQLDLTDSFEKNVAKLDHLPINKFNIIVCNFAFHYFFRWSKSQVEQSVSVPLLSKQGRIN